MSAGILTPIAWVGATSIAGVRHVGAATTLLGHACLAILKPPFVSPRLLMQQAFQIVFLGGLSDWSRLSRR